MPTIPTVYGKRVWRNQPSEFSEKVRLRGAIQGGRWAPRIQMVRADQATIRTTITVVMYMILKAFPLDSGIPLMFSHQK